MKLLITGANGFIGRNLGVHLSRRDDIEVVQFTRENKLVDLPGLLDNTDFVIHLAGINRPQNDNEFKLGNADLTLALCNEIEKTGREIPVIFTSSIQAELENPYGESKLLGEDYLKSFNNKTSVPVYIYRLTNVFGKWSKPNYNSVVATFCHSIVNDIPIKINNPDALIKLVYIDDVVEHFIRVVDGYAPKKMYCSIEPIYQTTVGELASTIVSFKESRTSMVTCSVGTGLVRALHATYLSYFSPEDFSYPLINHSDERGVFVEMLKTKDSGQFSFFSAHPGVTRGGHFHHTKTEKFLVIYGLAKFKFRNVISDETYEINVSGKTPKVVETVPGWTHDITNIGDKEMFVMLWANEIFDPENPDTFSSPL